MDQEKESAQDFTDGFTRFVFGLGKKVLIANYLAMMVDNIFLMENRSVATLWLGCIGYALQIYFDFFRIFRIWQLVWEEFSDLP